MGTDWYGKFRDEIDKVPTDEEVKERKESDQGGKGTSRNKSAADMELDVDLGDIVIDGKDK
ncbi:hypothetical protein [Streptomyces syringium]|uniref:hypothetical protein n=1 Tax=Streptomyces syringium TaxID=76729 RepID=UPI0034520B60